MSKSKDFLLNTENKDLTEKQRLFCHYYIELNFNGTQAAIRAGYSEDTAQEIASQNLSKLIIKDYIDRLKSDLGLRLGISREMIAREWAKIAFQDVRQIINDSGEVANIKDLSDNVAGAISGLEVTTDLIGNNTVKVKTWSKEAGLNALTKMLGYNEPDKLDVSGINPIINIIVSPSPVPLAEGEDSIKD